MFFGVRFQLLGSMRGWRDGKELRLGPPQQRTLLAMFLLAGGRQVPLETILNGLWGEDTPKAAVGTVRTYVSRLRGYLETRPGEGPGMLITSVGDGYVVEPGSFELDVDMFKNRFAEARAARANQETAKAAQLMRDALALWRGIPLAGMPGPYADARRLHLKDLCMAALEEKLALDVVTGEHAAAIPELRALLREHPFHEGLAGTLMLALYKSSRQAEALVVFDDMRYRLRDDLGVDPGPAMREMHQRILRADSELYGPGEAGARHHAGAQVVRLAMSYREHGVRRALDEWHAGCGRRADGTGDGGISRSGCVRRGLRATPGG
jgi:DNA-binding SARP family transcriptional activator